MFLLSNGQIWVSVETQSEKDLFVGGPQDPNRDPETLGPGVQKETFQNRNRDLTTSCLRSVVGLMTEVSS